MLLEIFAEDFEYLNEYDPIDVLYLWFFAFGFIDIELLSQHDIFKNDVLFTAEDEPEKLKDEFRKDFQVDFSRIFS